MAKSKRDMLGSGINGLISESNSRQVDDGKGDQSVERKTTSIKIDADLRKWFRVHCAENETTLTELIEHLLKKYKEEHLAK